MIKIDEDSEGRLIENEVTSLSSFNEIEHSESSQISLDENTQTSSDFFLHQKNNIGLLSDSFPKDPFSFNTMPFPQVDSDEDIHPSFKTLPNERSIGHDLPFEKLSGSKDSNLNEGIELQSFCPTGNSSLESTSESDSSNDLSSQSQSTVEKNAFSSPSSQSSFQSFPQKKLDKLQSSHLFKTLEKATQKYVDKTNAHLAFNNSDPRFAGLNYLGHDLELYLSKWKRRLAYILNVETLKPPISRSPTNYKTNNKKTFKNFSHGAFQLRPNSKSCINQQKFDPSGTNLEPPRENIKSPLKEIPSITPPSEESIINQESRLSSHNLNSSPADYFFLNLLPHFLDFNPNAWIHAHLKKFLAIIFVFLGIVIISLGNGSAKIEMNSSGDSGIRDDIIREMKKLYKDAHMDLVLYLERTSQNQIASSMEGIATLMENVKKDIVTLKDRDAAESCDNQMVQEDLIKGMEKIQGQLDHFYRHHENMMNSHNTHFIHILHTLEAAEKGNAHLRQILEQLDFQSISQCTQIFHRLEEENFKLAHQESHNPNSRLIPDKNFKQEHHVYNTLLNDAYNFFKNRFNELFPNLSRPSSQPIPPSSSQEKNFYAFFKKHASRILDKTMSGFHKFNSFIRSSFHTFSKTNPFFPHRSVKTSDVKKTVWEKFHVLRSNIDKFSLCLKSLWKQIYKGIFHCMSWDSLDDDSLAKLDECITKAFHKKKLADKGMEKMGRKSDKYIFKKQFA